MDEFVKNGKLVKMNKWELLELSKRPDLSQKILWLLSENRSQEVKCSVVKNKACPPLLLKTLAKEKNLMVKAAILDNPNCPPELFEQFYKENNVILELSLLKNKRTPKIIKKKIMESELKTKVQRYLALCKIGKRLTHRLLNEGNLDTKFIILSTKKLDRHIYEKYALSKTEKLRVAVACNPTIDIGIVDILIKNRNRAVYQRLIRNIKTEERHLIKIAKYIVDENQGYYPSYKRNYHYFYKLTEFFDHENTKTDLLTYLFSKKLHTLYYIHFIRHPLTPLHILKSIENDFNYKNESPRTYDEIKNHPNYRSNASQILDVLAQINKD